MCCIIHIYLVYNLKFTLLVQYKYNIYIYVWERERERERERIIIVIVGHIGWGIRWLDSSSNKKKENFLIYIVH